MAACPGCDLYRQMNRSLLRAPLTFCDGGVWCPSPIGSGYCILVWSTSGVKPLIGGYAERDLFYTTRAKLPNTTTCVFPGADSIAAASLPFPCAQGAYKKKCFSRGDFALLQHVLPARSEQGAGVCSNTGVTAAWKMKRSIKRSARVW